MASEIAAPEPPRVVPGARLSDPSRFINRELSWLDFNERVLELAEGHEHPLLERVKFCAIFSSNLDEFFMVRVAGLQRQIVSGLAVRSPDGSTPQHALAEIQERVRGLVARQSRLWREELAPALAAEGIHLARVEDCAADEEAELAERFEREVYPVLTPLAVGPGQPFPYISGLSLSLGLFVRDPGSGEERFARVKVPEGLPRFRQVGSRGVLVPLEDLIGHFLDSLFPGMEIVERSAFRVTRDADFEVSDEADDLLEAVELEVRRRRFGDVVRLEVEGTVSERMLERLLEGLDATPDEVVRIDGMLDLADLMQVAGLDRPELKDEPWLPVTQPRLEGRDARGLFAELRRADILVQHPYDSFSTSVDAFVRAVVRDQDVIGVKTTVYRTSDESAIMPTLIQAAEEGKQSVCLVELKARFDERRNIEWSRALEQAGVHVVYGFRNLKIHAKTTLVVRREGDKLRRYAHVGTGNYNAVTARLYEDFGLFTADEQIAADIADLFNYLTGFGRPQRFRKLLVAPFTLRSRLLEEIRAVAAAAAAGTPARIRIKVNALTDNAIIDELYHASQAGAEIDLMTRGICCLRPGVPGMSERIRVRSVLGRFLEHSRVFEFSVGDETRVFIGSSDLMPRNLDHRIEVVVPVEDPRVRAEIGSTLDVVLADNASAWTLGADGAWSRVHAEKGQRLRPTHAVLMRRALSLGRRRSGVRRAR
ncbi:MAG: polyphosphate kinase 1 [Thermoleophilia bacterium]